MILFLEVVKNSPSQEGTTLPPGREAFSPHGMHYQPSREGTTLYPGQTALSLKTKQCSPFILPPGKAVLLLQEGQYSPSYYDHTQCLLPFPVCVYSANFQKQENYFQFKSKQYSGVLLEGFSWKLISNTVLLYCIFQLKVFS